MSVGSAPDSEPEDVAKGAVLAFSPHSRLEYWIDTSDPNIGSDRHVQLWELEATNSGTRLALTVTFTRARRAANTFICGWHSGLEQLEEALDGNPVDWATHTRDRVIELYVYYRNKDRGSAAD